MDDYTLDEVYGINRDLPLNYAVRAKIDGAFVESLSRKQHIVIHGSSKQGKTSLRKHNLRDDDYVVISCLNTMSVELLNAAILKAVGYRVEQSQSRSVGGSHKFNLEFKGKGKVPFIAEAEGTGGYERESTTDEEVSTARLEIELSDVNDIISALKEIDFKQYIILEDFHYLPVDTQKDFAFALKAYHENSDYTFIIVGVWREENRLVYYNGDLTGRVISINADKWTPEELREVVTAGGKLLNVTFDDKFQEELIAGSSDAVHLVQETCRKACQAAGVFRTLAEPVVIGAGLDAGPLLNEVVDQQSGRYRAFITNFSEGFQVTGLEMYKWILFAVIEKDVTELENGIRRAEINDTLKANHPEGESLNPGNLSQALLSIASLQVQKNIRPIILDYDQTLRVLNIVDKSFITWLSYQDKADVFAELDIVR